LATDRAPALGGDLFPVRVEEVPLETPRPKDLRHRVLTDDIGLGKTIHSIGIADL